MADRRLYRGEAGNGHGAGMINRQAVQASQSQAERVSYHRNDRATPPCRSENKGKRVIRL
jgi:hypothetical protein